jgi:quercetin dioxygenase-like cupin family protein
MEDMMKRCCLAVALLFAGNLVYAQDAVKVDPGHHRVEMENEYVRVLRITIGAGEKTSVHQHPAGAVVFLTDAQTRVTPPQPGQPEQSARKAKEVMLLESTTHTVENVGQQPVELVLVELKQAPANRPLKNDAVKVDPKHYTVIAENDRMRAVRVTYGPGEKSAMHDHPPLVAVALTDSRFRMHAPDGKGEDIPALKRGAALFDDATTHLPENLGRTQAEVVLIELKSGGAR